MWGAFETVENLVSSWGSFYPGGCHQIDSWGDCMIQTETDFILEVVTKWTAEVNVFTWDLFLKAVTKWTVEVIACSSLRQILSWRLSPNGQLRTMFLPEADLILEVVTKWTVEVTLGTEPVASVTQTGGGRSNAASSLFHENTIHFFWIKCLFVFLLYENIVHFSRKPVFWT